MIILDHIQRGLSLSRCPRTPTHCRPASMFAHNTTIADNFNDTMDSNSVVDLLFEHTPQGPPKYNEKI